MAIKNVLRFEITILIRSPLKIYERSKGNDTEYLEQIQIPKVSRIDGVM